MVNLTGNLTAWIEAQLRSRTRLLVSFDGPDAAGKTTMADQVAAELPSMAVRVSVDGFHQPASKRRVRGDLSPEGYYFDTFDVVQVTATLQRFASGADEIVSAAFDHISDEAQAVQVRVPPRAVLLFDGVFLQRPEFRDYWDLSVYLDVPEPVTMQRALERDEVLFGDRENIQRRYRSKYLPGQAVYRSLDDPVRRADLVIENSVPSQQVVRVDRLNILREQLPRANRSESTFRRTHAKPQPGSSAGRSC